MLPLQLFFLFATAATHSKPLDVVQNLSQPKIALVQHRQSDGDPAPGSQRNMCFTIRSYFFRRQDGQAPVPAGMSTCTPASMLRQQRTAPGPAVRLVPVTPKTHDQ